MCGENNEINLKKRSEGGTVVMRQRTSDDRLFGKQYWNPCLTQKKGDFLTVCLTASQKITHLGAMYTHTHFKDLTLINIAPLYEQRQWRLRRIDTILGQTSECINRNTVLTW